ncbi:MAG: hypothetical protein CMG64_06705, partial [Candidatus Marinimicrobia bacterium]|nr:hypothetical protein [Candidatus Neomarinimicrobiota bacterium]
EFWGIQNFREKINEHFLSAHHSVPTEHIDLLDIEGTNNWNIIHGTNSDYIELIRYMETNEITDPIVQNALENWIDIKSFMNYYGFQIFIDNTDWPGNNIKYWRDHRVGGKWRWILYDTDFGFSPWEENAYTFNTLEFALEDNGPGWPNPPWSTFVFRTLMENDHFRNSFINIYSDMLNTVLQPDYISHTLDSLANHIASVIPAHRDRWYNNGNWPNSAVNWQYRLNNMISFGDNRRSYAIAHLMEEFGLPDTAQITVNIVPEGSGSIQLNTLEITESNWQGHYFPTVPIDVEAMQNDGFIFSHWLEYPDSNIAMSIAVTDPSSLTAVFVESQLTPGDVVINEINYNSSDDHDSGDWIELYNPGEIHIDISGWMMKDDDDQHIYNFPEETILDSGEYLIVAADLDLFFARYSSDIRVVGPFDFGLSGGGDAVRIFDDQQTLIDTVVYDDIDPWPIEPDGNGPTLELVNPENDNALPESWTSSQQYGSPGQQNTNFLNVDELEKENIPQVHTLMAAYPNPFNGSVRIPFKLASQITSSITIYNIIGQKVLEIPIKNYGPGDHSIVWDGRNQTGYNVGTGVYFVKLNVNTKNNYQKLIYLK